ncbi:DUF4279 domain-containing protein [Streptomyces hainanensis]|nr:DUF4279 domain-containing protein [Streptomyces hainanensis]
MNYTHTEHPWVQTDATLVISKSDLVPEAVTERLGLEPTGTRLPGPSRWDPDGDPSGLWLLERAERELGHAGQVDAILDAITPSAEVLRELMDEGYDVGITTFGYVGTGAVLELSPAATTRLASLGIPLKLIVSTSNR